MPTLTFKVPAVFAKNLRTAAQANGESLSSLVRRALDKEVAEPAPDFVKRAKPYKGIFKGPRDLSTRGIRRP